MAKYKIIGVEHLKGTSKKTGKPYDVDILHVESFSPPRNREFIGNEVNKIIISRDSGILVAYPKPGQIYDIGFNRSGYVDYADFCK